MKTKFNWGMFFTVILVIACIYCAFYGLITAMVTESWTPMWWLAPGVLLIAGYFAAQEGNEDRRYCFFQEQEAKIKRHEEMIQYLASQVGRLDKHISDVDERLDS